MNVSRWLKENEDKIVKLIDLEDVQSKSDPCEFPYKSLYAARDIMRSCLTDLDENLKSNLNADNFLQLVYFSLSFRLANNYISTEERSPGEEIIDDLCHRLDCIPFVNRFLSFVNSKVSSVEDIEKNENDQKDETEFSVAVRCMGGILLRIYNTRGMLWAYRIIDPVKTTSDDPAVENSLKYLRSAKNIYKQYKCLMKRKDSFNLKCSKTDLSLDYDPPECLDSLLIDLIGYETPFLKNECNLLGTVQQHSEAVRFDLFESDYTTTLFLLAQTFGKMSSKHKSAKYCYWTLSRQLNALKYDPVEWSLNAATLSQYFLSQKLFERARHCIAAAQIILKEAVVRPTPGPQKTDEKQDSVSHCVTKLPNDHQQNCGKNEEITDTQKRLKKLLPDPLSDSRFWDDDVYEEKRVQGEADIDRCWINYGLTLLEMSFDRISPDYNKSEEESFSVQESAMPNFNLTVDSVESEITCDWIGGNFEDARKVFLFVQQKINSAKRFYRMDYRCSDYVDLVFDYSRAYKCISNFEYNTERKCCMEKKRIDMLQELLNTLNQDYYLMACRKMMLEIGEIYSSMITLKLSLLEASKSEEPGKLPANAKSVAQKINRLANQGIQIYQRFLESYRNRNGQMPEVFSDDDIRPVLIAHFYMARLYSKVIETNNNTRIQILRKSLEHYQFIANYCNEHESAAKLMVHELDSCRDMTVLLPCKIDKILSQS